MKNLLRLLPVIALILASFVAVPARAQQKGAMQIGLAARYAWPGMDLDSFDPAPGYGVVFHYFLTSTTSIDGNLDYLALNKSVSAPGGSVDLDYTQWALSVGLRYRPKVDFLVRPFGEVGLGYELWDLDLDLAGAENRSGSSIIYFAGLGYDWELTEDFFLTTSARYYYLPLNDQLQDKVVTTSGGKPRVEKTDLFGASQLTAGVELTWRFK